MLGEDVDLDIDAIAGPDDAQRRDGQRVGNEHDRERVGPDVDQGEADAVDGDRSFGDQERRPGSARSEGEEFPLALRAAVAEDGGGVDVTLDEMSAQAMRRPSCAARG